MTDDEPVLDEEQRYRASVYALLAALLRAPPSAELLAHLRALAPAAETAEDELSAAMAALAEAAENADPARLEDEYNQLFIGLGRGEVLPYGSYYRTGFLMEKPLSDLREDLRRLGFVRADDTREPEDHIAALYEVFSVIIADSHGFEEQQRFHAAHIDPWTARFFEDLGTAQSADFYRFVARFGAAMTKLETTYLSLDS